MKTQKTTDGNTSKNGSKDSDVTIPEGFVIYDPPEPYPIVELKENE